MLHYTMHIPNFNWEMHSQTHKQNLEIFFQSNALYNSMNKFCPKCKENKSVEQFYYRKTEKRYHQWCKVCTYTYQKDRWKHRKYQAMEIMGGKCSGCNYDKNYAAMEFHHIDPEQKEFAWDKLRQTAWSTIIEELKKCILLCSNCHREIHNPQAHTNNSNIANKSLQDSVYLKPTGICPNCKTETFGTKFCSTMCAKDSRRRVKRPSKTKFQELIKTKSNIEIGKQFNVSETTIRKWKQFYGLD